jgi:geranylgeranyl pyrophosphate synthase
MTMIDTIRNLVLPLPEFQAWPQMASVFERAGSKPRTDWELPVLAGQAVGGDPAVTVYGAAAIACLQVSIILVDDILDDDPRGEHLKVGPGRAANLAVALQAAASQIVARAPVGADRQAAAQRCLADAAQKTAFGQQLDAENLDGEANYWRVVQNKSSPFYAAALELGGILGGADPATADGLNRLGALVGEIVQLNDDALDAFETPANPDWLRGRNNLLILYARTAPHPEQDRFLQALGQISQPGVLADAQQLLIRCGAASYVVYQIVQRWAQAQQLMTGLPLADPEVLNQRLSPLTPALAELLRSHGVQFSNRLVQ